MILPALLLSLAVAQPAPGPGPPPPPAFYHPFYILFKRGSAEITPEGLKMLENFVAASRRCSECSEVLVTGHTDLAGDEDYNVGLSRRRAEAVAAYLRKRRLPPTRVLACGEARPLFDRSDAEADALNRRVEVGFPPPSVASRGC